MTLPDTERCKTLTPADPEAAGERAKLAWRQGTSISASGRRQTAISSSREGRAPTAGAAEAVRAAVGDQMELMVDLHAALSPAEADLVLPGS